MRIPKTLALAVLAAACATSAWAADAAPDWKPSRPVRIIVPIVGSTNDVLARLVAPKLQEAFGQPFVVENKGGAGGNIGAAEVARAAPDGQTLLVGYNGPLAINVTLFDKMPFDPRKDLAPIVLAVKSPQYLVVNPSTGIRDVRDFIAKAKANPAKYSYGSVSMGSASHLTMEMMKSAADFRMTHVPYRGAGPAVADLLAGNVQAGFFVPGNVQGFVKDGRLKLLATSGAKRFPSTPDVPTLAESGLKDFEATSWIGFLAPGGTPPNIIKRYNEEFVRILAMPDIKARLEEMEFEVVAGTPQDFGRWIDTEIGRWGKVIKDTGAKVD
ncbi:Bug family tripartite tricarboxylate transporter substrate binding protein [Pseudacidovorax intermedius]|uniref:Tripartite-type tricarboxylate transporter receptor subunit TctC n=1 Tax=Pseudacidovorax intermedius TaxID=433924 RepID=A0A370F9W7_9BURK|nr:tripartite tricarboxylate transporter substrate binding protein [Pseudacidovorax intermedius]RDI21899.1 tripartite-type tricarboxylate transporter receptor subunit TctC [Pseudacidovorax intermedius]